MKNHRIASLCSCAALAFAQLSLLGTTAHAQSELSAGHWYVSWGYNAQGYAATDIRFVQPSFGNDFTVRDVHFNDHKSWDVWNHDVTVPQYSVRIGRTIGKNRSIEFNYDHAKAILATDRDARVTGTIAGVHVDQTMHVADVVQIYKLNNGANFFLFNFVQGVPLHGVPFTNGSVAFLGKAGLGFMIPHTDNTVLGHQNVANFQFGGFGAGVEAALRVHFLRRYYLEGGEKGFFGHYRNVHLSQGAASQDLWAHGTILSIGAELGKARGQ